ncbi:hypothetical protein GCM10009557_17310 [Virgisporangium ochraceum]
MNRPAVVSAEEWKSAREELLTKEKALTRALDALAAERRRMPMTRLPTGHTFTAPDGATVDLPGLFDGYRQVVIYHHMLEPGQDWLCNGCSSFTDNIADQSHLNARDTRVILMSRAPQEEIAPVRKSASTAASASAYCSATATRSSAPTSPTGAGSTGCAWTSTCST